MHLSSIRAANLVNTVNLSKQSSTQQTKSASNNTVKAYSLDVSDEAKGLSKNSETDSFDDLQVPDGVPPVEAYALPQWQVDLLPAQLLMKPVIGESYIGSSSEKYNSLSSGTRAGLQEYSRTLQEYTNEEMNKLGITNSLDYYYKCLQDAELSEKVHQAVLDRLADDPRMMELMQSFGLSLN